MRGEHVATSYLGFPIVVTDRAIVVQAGATRVTFTTMTRARSFCRWLRREGTS
jgi:hypothetical protein